jgi:hypothetical protein
VLYGADMLGPFQSIGNAVPFLHGEGRSGQLAGALLFFALALILSRFARRKIE